jgi:hypothetical protein
MKICFSKAGTFIVSSRTTSTKSNLLVAPQAKHCITAPIHARAHGAIGSHAFKRLRRILGRDTRPGADYLISPIKSAVADLQQIRFDIAPGMMRPLRELAEALRVDLHWIREHTRLPG